MYFCSLGLWLLPSQRRTRSKAHTQPSINDVRPITDDIALKATHGTLSTETLIIMRVLIE